jgi:hypothetical protein
MSEQDLPGGTGTVLFTHVEGPTNLTTRPGDGCGDRDKARQPLTEAIAMYRQIGMPKHVEMAEALLSEVKALGGWTSRRADG